MKVNTLEIDLGSVIGNSLAVLLWVGYSAPSSPSSRVKKLGSTHGPLVCCNKSCPWSTQTESLSQWYLKKKNKTNFMCPEILVLGRSSQVDHKFQANLGYIVRSFLKTYTK